MPKVKRKQLRFKVNGPEEKKPKKEETTKQQQITSHFQNKKPVYR